MQAQDFRLERSGVRVVVDDLIDDLGKELVVCDGGGGEVGAWGHGGTTSRATGGSTQRQSCGFAVLAGAEAELRRQRELSEIVRQDLPPAPTHQLVRHVVFAQLEPRKGGDGKVLVPLNRQRV